MRRSCGERLFSVCNTVLMIMLALITLYPLIYVFFASLSDPLKLSGTKGLMLRPSGFSWQGYAMVLHNPNIWNGYMNTCIYVGLGTTISLVMTTISAFVLTREGFKLRKPLYVAIIFTMFFSGGMIPRFLLIRTLGLYNNIGAMILPEAISTYNLLVMCNSMRNIPKGLEESAYIDGANDIQVLWCILVPLLKQTLAVMVLFYAVYNWNAWFDAMLFLRDRSKFPLQLFLREILIQDSTTEMTVEMDMMQASETYYRPLLQYCTIIVTTIPILMIYPFLQKYFVKGVMIGAVKG